MPAILRTGRVCESRADVACILHEHPSYPARKRLFLVHTSVNGATPHSLIPSASFEAEDICSITLVAQRSVIPCNLGQTFGCVNKTTMWADGQCAGLFKLNGLLLSCHDMVATRTECGPQMLMKQHCGYSSDCHAHYDLALLADSARNAHTNDAVVRATSNLAEAHSRARAACASSGQGIKDNGAWCYNRKNGKAPTLVVSKHCPPKYGEKKYDCWMELQNNQSYRLPINHVPADSTLVDVLSRLLADEKHGPVSIVDFGAGVGQVCHTLLSLNPRANCRAYDGGGDVEEVTGGFVRFLDLSVELALQPADWLLSLAVGEAWRPLSLPSIL